MGTIYKNLKMIFVDRIYHKEIDCKQRISMKNLYFSFYGMKR